EIVELEIDNFGSTSERYMKGVDVHWVTDPLHALPIHAGCDSGKTRNGTGGRVVSRYPLGIKKHDFLGPMLDGNLLVHVSNAVVSIGEINLKLHRTNV